MSSETNDEVPYFEVEILQHSCIGDTLIYADHIYKIRVCVGERIYGIQRSYPAFCELDTQLRRKVKQNCLHVNRIFDFFYTIVVS